MQGIDGPSWLSVAREIADPGRSGDMIPGILLISDFNASLISRSSIAQCARSAWTMYWNHKREVKEVKTVTTITLVNEKS